MSPELQGEILALNLYTRSGGFLPRLCRIIRKLDGLLEAADTIRATPSIGVSICEGGEEAGVQ